MLFKKKANKAVTYKCENEKINAAFFKDCEPLTVGALKRILKHVKNDVVIHTEWMGAPEDYTLAYGAYFQEIDYGDEKRHALVIVNDEERHIKN